MPGITGSSAAEIYEKECLPYYDGRHSVYSMGGGSTTLPFLRCKSLSGTCYALSRPFPRYKSLSRTCYALLRQFLRYKSPSGTCYALLRQFLRYKSLSGTCYLPPHARFNPFPLQPQHNGRPAPDLLQAASGK